MKLLILICLLIMLISPTSAQKLTITTLDNFNIEVEIVSDPVKTKLLHDLQAKQDNSIRKQWTARTFRLSDGRILVEFYDGQAVIIEDQIAFERLREVRFVKNYIDFLKKNISYRIEIAFQKGIELAGSAKRIAGLKPSRPEYFDFEVYEMISGQILFISKSENRKSAMVYENMKALCSDNMDILSQYYKGMEAASEKLVNGDPLLDYEVSGHWVYPKDLPALISNHHLSLVESKIYVDNFYGNLYISDNGYYVLIDEVDQPNGAGNKMRILTVRIYEKKEEVRDAQVRYEKFKKEGVRSSHFYQEISDKYGKDFSLYTARLIDSLPSVLNFDREQLAFDSVGMAIVDEAIRWHHANSKYFDAWFPAVLAYYGQCYSVAQKSGKWIVKKEKDYNVWMPHFVLPDGEDAFDMYDFYKDLSEWPQSIKEAGDWDGWRKRMRKDMRSGR